MTDLTATDTLEPTPEMRAHLQLTPILESFSFAWGNLKDFHEKALKLVLHQIECDVECQKEQSGPRRYSAEQIRENVRRGYKSDLERLEAPVDTLDRRIKAAPGLLVVTKKEKDDGETDRMLLPDWLIRMAELAGRLKIID